MITYAYFLMIAYLGLLAYSLGRSHDEDATLEVFCFGLFVAALLAPVFGRVIGVW